KNVFQVHSADADGSTVFNRKIKRADLLEFFAISSPIVAIFFTTQLLRLVNNGEDFVVCLTSTARGCAGL
ncbi:hypothetical protein ACC702_39645, partial [Rhizobium ruizarguesonis]